LAWFVSRAEWNGQDHYLGHGCVTKKRDNEWPINLPKNEFNASKGSGKGPAGLLSKMVPYYKLTKAVSRAAQPQNLKVDHGCVTIK